MQVKRLLLQHVGRFESLEMPLAPSKEGEGRVTVIIGNNGAGKTSILEALSTSLSWLVARILREKGAGKTIDDLTICNGKSYAVVDAEVEINGTEYFWRLAKTLKARKKRVETELGGVTKLAGIDALLFTQRETPASLQLLEEDLLSLLLEDMVLPHTSPLPAYQPVLINILNQLLLN